MNVAIDDADRCRGLAVGDAVDTTGAICGQMAGAFYGESEIPGQWVERLVQASEIREMADRLGAEF